MTYTPLRIAAEEDEDLEIIAACLQDAIIPLAGLVFDTALLVFGSASTRLL